MCVKKVKTTSNKRRETFECQRETNLLGAYSVKVSCATSSLFTHKWLYSSPQMLAVNYTIHCFVVFVFKFSNIKVIMFVFFCMWLVLKKEVGTENVQVTLQEQEKTSQKAQEVSDLHAGKVNGKAKIAAASSKLRAWPLT